MVTEHVLAGSYGSRYPPPFFYPDSLSKTSILSLILMSPIFSSEVKAPGKVTPSYCSPV